MLWNISNIGALTKNKVMFPKWVVDICPEVVKHMTLSPFFNEADHVYIIPISTTKIMAMTVCLMKVGQRFASAVGSPFNLHAGSQLGAILHGGAIPWDDDVDIIIPVSMRSKFIEYCNTNGHKIHRNVTFKCTTRFHKSNSSFKLYLEGEGSLYIKNRGDKFRFPYVDIFSYTVKGKNIIQEINPYYHVVQTFKNYYPLKPFYFNGVTLLGPQDSMSRDRYDLKKAMIGSYNHRLETFVFLNNHKLFNKIGGRTLGGQN